MPTKILDDFLVVSDRGLYCPYGNFYLDPHKPVQHAVISHAHADHAVRGNKQVYCTLPTRLFMELRYKKAAGDEFLVYSFEQKFTLNGVEICFYPAGHILGSALTLMVYQGVRYLYTGDYKLQADASCEALKLVTADVLITESTFANPDVQHPNPAEEIKKLNEVSQNIILGCYALGKCQSLIHLINTNCPDKKILLNHSMLSLSRIYEQQGYVLGNYEVYNRKLLKQANANYIYLAPPLVFNGFVRASNVVRVFASGWKYLQQQNNLSLYISDHVDWNGILESVSFVSPQEIWTLHGDGKHLKKHFENRITVKILN
jgi:putative mRNA 3-end processing factor